MDGDNQLVKPKVTGPSTDRKCRDVFFILLLIVTWGVMAVIASLAFDKGDPSLIVLPMDTQGNLCGRDNSGGRKWIAEGKGKDFTNEPYLYFMNPFNLTKNRCVSACPSETDLNAACHLPSGADDGGSFLPAANRTGCICTYDDEGPVECYSRYQSEPIARRCLPGNATLLTEQLEKEVDRFNSWTVKTAKEEGTAMKWIGISAAMAFVLGFVYMVLLRYLGGVIVWLSIFLCWAACAAFSAWLYFEGVDRTKAAEERVPEDAEAKRNAKAITIASYVALGLTFILLCLIVFMFRRIQIAIGCIKHASRAIAAMPFVFLVPIVTFMVVALVIVYGVFVGVYLFSAGEIVVEGCCRRFVFDKTLERMIWFHLFGVIWSALFIVGVSVTVVNVAVADFYFTAEGTSFSSAPVSRATKIVFRFHLGSVAFGTLVIAIVVVIRIWFALLQRQLERLKENSTVRMVLCCVNCCLACFHRFLEFITSHAFVQIAITGKGFCGAAKDAWQLIAANPIRVAAVTGVSAFVIVLGKIFITVATLFTAMELIKLLEDPPIDSWVVFVIIGLVAYLVADGFLEVYESAVRTILQCFIVDEGDASATFAPDDLKRYMKNVGERRHIDGGGKSSAAPQEPPKV